MNGSIVIQVFLSESSELEAFLLETAIIEVFCMQDTELQALFN